MVGPQKGQRLSLWRMHDMQHEWRQVCKAPLKQGTDIWGLAFH